MLAWSANQIKTRNRAASALYRPYLESLYKDDELKSNDMDLQGAMSQLQQKELNYDKVH